MKLYYCPDHRSRRCMKVDVPDDIGPAIDLGVKAPTGRIITAIDYAKGTYTCEDGTWSFLPLQVLEADSIR